MQDADDDVVDTVVELVTVPVLDWLPGTLLPPEVICWELLLVANEYDSLVIWPMVLVVTSHTRSCTCTCARICGAQQAHRKMVSDRMVSVQSFENSVPEDKRP